MADADPQPSRSTWPALLAQHLGFEYECWAQPGCGNLMVAEQVIHHLSLPNNDTQPAVFVINWTYSDRFDYCDPANDTSGPDRECEKGAPSSGEAAGVAFDLPRAESLSDSSL